MDPVGEQTRGVSRVYGWFDRAGVHDLTKGLYEEMCIRDRICYEEMDEALAAMKEVF